MQSKSVINIEQRKPSVSKLMDEDPFLDHVSHLFQKIEKRAYELFEQRGCEHGQDRADWLKAEAELLREMPYEILEKGNELMVRAEVPGFNQRGLEVKVEPRRMFISGHKELVVQSSSESTSFSDRRHQDIFCALELPVNVNPDRASVTMHEGILTVFVQKEKAADQKAASTAA